jgi:ABC-type transport system involved in multi-copper enzyme maturation permease subunit
MSFREHFMSALLDTSRDWLRWLGWSNTRQAWAERGAIALSLAAAGLLLAFGGRLSALQAGVLWALLGLALAAATRRGWLKLLGPAFFFDLVRMARRQHLAFFRALYAAILLALLLCVYCAWFLGPNKTVWEVLAGGDVRSANMAAFSASFFVAFVALQFTVVVVTTPGAVAGAIAEEKERQTLDYLLATDLRSREIVLGKLAARLAQMALLVLTGLPILGLLQLVGGVDPDLVLASFAATAVTMLSLAGLAILQSVYARKPREAVVRTYLVVAGYLILSTAVQMLLGYFPALRNLPSVGRWTSPVTLQDLADWFSGGNAFAAFFYILQAVEGGTRLDQIVPTMLRQYTIIHLLVAISCTGWAVLRLRPVARKQAEHGRPRFFGLVGMVRPPVGRHPVLWKEVFVHGVRTSWVVRLLLVALVVAGFVPALIIIHGYMTMGPVGRPWRNLGDEMNGWVRTVGSLGLCGMLLHLALRAASSVAGERDRQTLDGVVITRLNSSAILFGKRVGSLLSVRWAWLWLGSVWALALVTGGLDPLAAPLVVGAWLVHAFFFINLATWFSVVSPTAMKATTRSVLTLLALVVGPWGLWMWFYILLPAEMVKAIEAWARFQAAGLTPPITLGFLAFSPAPFRSPAEELEWWQWLVDAGLGLMCYSGAAVLLWWLANRRFRTLTRGRPLRRPKPPALPLPTPGEREAALALAPVPGAAAEEVNTEE